MWFGAERLCHQVEPADSDTPDVDAEVNQDSGIDADAGDPHVAVIYEIFDGAELFYSGLLYGIAHDGNDIWISSEDEWRRHFYILDQDRRSLIPQFDLENDGSPNGNGFTWDGEAFWIGDNDRIARHDRTGSQLSICVGSFGDVMGMTFAAESLFLAADGHDNDGILEMDPRTCASASRWSITWNDDGLTWNGRAFLSADWDNAVIYKLSQEFEVGNTIDIPGTRPAGLQWVDGFLWLVSYGDQTIYQLGI